MTYAAVEIADQGRDEAKKLVNYSGSYKPYRDADGNLRMSSRPGEPPSSGTQYNLYNTIFSRQITPKNQNPAMAAFGSYAEYAMNLEYGTSWYAPRPFMRVARAKMLTLAPGIVAGFWSRAVTKKIKSMKAVKMAPIIVDMG